MINNVAVVCVGHSRSVGGQRSDTWKVSEYDLCLDISKRVTAFAQESGFNVKLIDAGETVNYPAYKIRDINNINPKFAIEFHFDSYAKEDEEGNELPAKNVTKTNPHILYMKNNEFSRVLAKDLAEGIDEICADVKFKKTTFIEFPHPGYNTSFFLDKIHCSSMIIELGWMNNDKQIKEFMQNDKFKNQLSKKISEKICLHL